MTRLLSIASLLLASVGTAADYKCVVKVENLPVPADPYVGAEVTLYLCAFGEPVLQQASCQFSITQAATYTITFHNLNLPAGAEWAFRVFDDSGPFPISGPVWDSNGPGVVHLEHDVKTSRVRPVTDTSEQVRLNSWTVEE